MLAVCFGALGATSEGSRGQKMVYLVLEGVKFVDGEIQKLHYREGYAQIPSTTFGHISHHNLSQGNS